MAISLMTPVRTVLLVGDEALYVYKVTQAAVKLVDSVPWQTDEFEEVVAGLIRKECGGKPVLVLNDMTDQHFKGGQRLPKVGMMDQANILKRKLQVAFPNYPIRGALPVKVKDKAKKSENIKGMGGLYLFAAVPGSEQIVKTQEAVKQSMASVAGFTLLPVESADMVRVMSEKLAGRSRKPSRWVVFIGQHQNGALRQVITRDGQLAMTRMTPVSDPETDSQSWAHEVSQEFKATISYLSRFGYSAEEGTDVIAIASQKNGEVLGKLIDVPCNYSSFTAPEAARLLGMKIGLQDDGAYAEPLHVAWAGRKTKFILPMDAPDLSRIYKPRQAVAAVVFLLFLSGCFLTWQLLSKSQELIANNSDLDTQKNVLAQAETDYQQEVSRMDALGFDIKMIKASTNSWDSFESDRIHIIALIKQIGQGLGTDIRLDRFTVDQVVQAPAPVDPYGAPLPDEKKNAQLEAKLSLSFPQTIEMETGMKAVFDLEKRLKGALPDYDVVITQQIGRPVYTESLKGEVGKTAQEQAAEEDYMAELMIRGPK